MHTTFESVRDDLARSISGILDEAVKKFLEKSSRVREEKVVQELDDNFHISGFSTSLRNFENVRMLQSDSFAHILEIPKALGIVQKVSKTECPHFNPNDECIYMLPVHNFVNLDFYFHGLFHEIGHWTKIQLNRWIPSEAEEIVAEFLGIALCKEFGVHPASGYYYIQTYLREVEKKLAHPLFKRILHREILRHVEEGIDFLCKKLNL